jgi:hypothetical protein
VSDELVDFSLTPTTFYIGYDPDTASYLTGVISQLRIDPPAFGSRGG